MLTELCLDYLFHSKFIGFLVVYQIGKIYENVLLRNLGLGNTLYICGMSKGRSL